MRAVCVSTACRVGWRGAAAVGLVFAFAAPQGVFADAAGQDRPVVVAKPSQAPASRKNLFVDGSRVGLPAITPETAPQQGGLALGINCTQPEANCQLPDQAGHGEVGIIGATSDAAAGFIVADNFTATANERILSICWWGFYLDFDTGDDCAASVPADDFTIRFLTNTPGCPSGSPNIAFETITQAQFTSFTRVATGNQVGGNDEYEYTATFLTAPFVAGTCNWLEISNDTSGTPQPNCLWLWSTAASASEDPPGNGDGWSWQTGAADPANDFDQAWCIDQALGDQVACSAANPPAPQCVGATGECWQENATPGCDEECCCTLVCVDLPLCCLTTWTAACAAAALDIGCTVLPPNPLCAEGGPGDPGQDPANCQVFSDVNAFNSTTNPGPAEDLFRAADDFTTLNNETLTEICWQGTYGVAAVTDNFRIRILGDAGGFPDETNVLADVSQGSFASFVREDTNVLGAGGWIIYQYRVTLATGVPVTGGDCYFLEVTNGIGDQGESWFWEQAGNTEGNGRAFIDGFGDDTIPPDGWDAFDVLTGLDYAFCLGVPLDPPACGFELLYETGNHEVVLFNGTPSNLGWSSGDLGAGPPWDHQRRTAQAFTLPPLPPDANAWSVEQILLEGFVPAGVTNEFLNFEIFARTSLDQDIQEADSLFQLFDIAITGDPTDPVFPNEFGILATGLFIEPGDYWLTFWASNSSAPPGEPQPISSNIAWFTNAPDGINNSCTVSFPPPAEGFDGCAPSDPDGQPAGTIAMLRARRWPEQTPPVPSDGFGGYWLPPAVLDVDPGNDPTPDPDDLYNAAFRMRGTAVLVVECPWDCQTEPDGEVGVNDFLAMLAQWGGPGSCDFDGGGVGITDFLEFLGFWGPCP